MGRTIQPAKAPGGTVPFIQGMVYAPAGQAFITGAALALNGTQQIIEATSPITGATLVGFAAQPVDSNPGYQVANANVTLSYTGRENVISVWMANEITVFSSTLVNGSAVPVTPTQADVGKTYGLAPYTAANILGLNEWYVDKSLTGANATVQIAGFSSDLNIVFFKVLAARLAQP
jgi:hypothetical protein